MVHVIFIIIIVKNVLPFSFGYFFILETCKKEKRITGLL